MFEVSQVAPNDIDERIVPLEGARNVRDAGGYPTIDGRIVRWGAIYRSGRVNKLSRGDVDYLSELGIATVFDLRTPYECLLSPNPYHGMADVAIIPCWCEFDGSGPSLSLVEAVHDERGVGAAHLYASLVSMRPQIQKMLRAMASGPSTILIHSSNGERRCGLAVAAILLLLGVSEERIVQDYALSQELLSSPDAGAAMPEADHLPSVFRRLDRDFGSAFEFLGVGDELSKWELFAIRKKFLC